MLSHCIGGQKRLHAQDAVPGCWIDRGVWTVDRGLWTDYGKGLSWAPCASAGPKPTDEHNRCKLKPGTPKRSGKALFLVSLLGRLPLQVVYFGLPRLALPNPVPEAGVGTPFIGPSLFEEIPPAQCRFVRLRMTDWPRPTPLGTIELTVFGKAAESLPAAQPIPRAR
jgi:hypothetical protein